jgi:hypothetical protein
VAPDQLAFELYAYLEMTNFHFVLFRDPRVVQRGRTAVRTSLERAARRARSRPGR